MEEELVLLVAAAQRKDAAAFASLIRRFERTALAIAYAQLGDANLAGDAVQESFLRAWQRLGSLADPAKFAPWLCGIVRNEAIDQRRKRRAVPADGDLAAETGAVFDDPGAQMDRSARRELIAAALETLDDVSRSAVVLRYYEGLGSREIGELIGLSASAVDMRLSRAREELRGRLAPMLRDQMTADTAYQSRT